jgi:hypothetical protein
LWSVGAGQRHRRCVTDLVLLQHLSQLLSNDFVVLLARSVQL